MPRPKKCAMNFLHIFSADAVAQIGGQVGYDVLDRIGHGRKRVVGAQDDVVGAERVDCRLASAGDVLGTPAMSAPLSSRPIMAGSVPAPCARQRRTPGRRWSAPLVISSAAAMPVSTGIPAPNPIPALVIRGGRSWSLGCTNTRASSSAA